ncbi:hypothetical protein N9L68_09445, partial [bacterium]|nr:hypothetical protein [bacterium]
TSKVIRKLRIWDRLVSRSITEEFGHKEVDTQSTTNAAPPADILANLFDDVRDEPRVAPSAATASERVQIEEYNKLLEEARRVKYEATHWAHRRFRT